MTSTSKSLWIGPDENLSVGDVGFLIERSHERERWTRYEIRHTPPYTNRSHEPKLFGWCGSYNGLSTSGVGLVRVMRVARNGRAFVEQLEGDDLATALDELGYPDLVNS